MPQFIAIVKLIFFGLIIYSAYGALLYLLQRSMIYPGQYLPANSEIESNSNLIEQIKLNTSFGIVEAIYLNQQHTDSSVNKAVVFAHGNNELISDCIDEMMPYVQMGYAVLLVEFPGYGRSAGKPSEASIGETFINAYDWLKEKAGGIDQQTIGHGRSLGGAAICNLAKSRNFSAIILQSTFSDIRKFANRYLLPGFLVRDSFNNLDVIKNFQNPVFIFHGRHDDVIPFSHGQELSRVINRGEFVVLNCAHNDCLLPWPQIEQFLQKNGLL